MQDIAGTFRDCFAAELRAHRRSEPLLSRFIEELEAIDCASPRQPAAKAPPPAVATYLQPALDRMQCAPPFADAVRTLAGVVDWYQIFQGEGIEPSLAKGLVAAQMAGQVGIVGAAAIRTGLFLLAPGVHYPLHQHGALEIYFVVSGTLTLQHGRTGAPFEVHPGHWSVTPSHRVHALTVRDAPCLVIYAWVGAVEAPNWWWEQDDDGTWHRVGWERQPDARWLRTKREPITEAILQEAGEA